MGRPRIEEVNYQRFRAALDRARNEGTRIEPSEVERWKAYVEAHQVREPAMRSFARKLGDDTVPVIIDAPNEWGGYYRFSDAAQACLKWIPPD